MEQRDRRLRIIRSTLAISAPTALSRVLGYVRDSIQAFHLGTGPAADAFTLALAIPNLLRRLSGEGAFSAAFVPLFTRLRGRGTRETSDRFAAAAFWDLAIVAAAFAALGAIFAPALVRVFAHGFRDLPGQWALTIGLTRTMFPFLVFISLSTFVGGLLNSLGRFSVPAFAPVMFNVTAIAAALVFAGRAAEPAGVFAWGFVAGGAASLAWQLPFLGREGVSLRAGPSFRDPAVRRLGGLLGPGIVGAGLYQVNFALSRMMASGLREGSAASLYYASRLEELTLGLFSIALASALLPPLSEQAAARDIEGLKSTVSFSLRLTALVTLPAAAGLMALSRPIMSVLFERGRFDAGSTEMSAACLVFFALGLPFLSGTKIVASAFFALTDTRTPVVIGVLGMVVYLAAAFALMGPLEVRGLALALALSQALNFLGLLRRLKSSIGPLPMRAVLVAAGRALGAAALMGFAVAEVFKRLNAALPGRSGQAAALLGAIAAGLLFYGLLAGLLYRRDLIRLKGLLQNRRIA